MRWPKVIWLTMRILYAAISHEWAVQHRLTLQQQHTRLYVMSLHQVAFWQERTGRLAAGQGKRAASLAQYHAEWLTERGYPLPALERPVNE